MAPRRTLVVTGTDTDVGKTWVTCRLAEDLRALGAVVRTVKPLESGCAAGDAGAHEDGVLLARAAAQGAPSEALIRLPAPVAPPVAADEAGITLDWDEVVARTRAALDGADVALVEGAGGLLSPLTWERTAVDLAQALDAEALVVAADRLGAINHVRLTVGALERAGVTCAAVVLSEPAEAGIRNAESLAALSGLPPIFEVGRDQGTGALGRWILG